LKVPRAISIVVRSDDALAGRPPVRWAIEQLRGALEAKGVKAAVLAREGVHDRTGATLLVAGSETPAAAPVLARAGVSIPNVPEAFALVPGGSGDHPVLLACGADERGLVYAVLELADRTVHAGEPLPAIRVGVPIVERPANAVRSVARLFTSEVNDKPWFHDEGFWRRYLSMLAAQRFNRFSLTFGLGYNFPRRVTDAYLYFAYPFLVDVPGHRVQVPRLPDEERERNLEMLRFVGEETVARGLDFQLGLWTHAYEWVDSPDARHRIEGLTRECHAAYCRDALQVLLEACPAIGGLTLRTHGESGIPERSWEFWRTVLDGVVRSGRRVGIDLHAKGLDHETLGLALATGLPVTVSPKYWAEHMGLPYHQAGIRELERPPVVDRHAVTEWERFMAVSEGSRPFTRYGYGDLLREDRAYDVVFRLWPGTQRLLLWGDPAMAAGFGRHAGLAGGQGLEWCEPLSFKGREGSGLPGPRDGYQDPSLSPGDDWQKYEYAYRLLGRLTYHPDAHPETWRRYLRARFAPAARSAEGALASASRILPLVTTAHHPSASNNYYWPEIYTDMPIVWRDGAPQTHPYLDTPAPRRFGTVSPLDPEIFASVEESVRGVLSGERSGRYSPLEVASWLEKLSEDAAHDLARMEAELTDSAPPEARRLVVDVAIQEALGRFFAGKLRAAVLYEVSVNTGSRVPLEAALAAYRAARTAWAQAADHAAGAYIDDLTFGPQPYLRGSWSDRLPSIDRDIDDMTSVGRTRSWHTELPEALLRRLVAEAGHGSPTVAVSHWPPGSFRRGASIALALDVGRAGPELVAAVRLRYRRMDQSEAYAEVEMTRENDCFIATIPGGYLDTPYALQYLFVLWDARGTAWRYPGLGADLSDQPYYVVRAERQVQTTDPGGL
jgi:hypothetical protein